MYAAKKIKGLWRCAEQQHKEIHKYSKKKVNVLPTRSSNWHFCCFLSAHFIYFVFCNSGKFCGHDFSHWGHYMKVPKLKCWVILATDDYCKLINTKPISYSAQLSNLLERTQVWRTYEPQTPPHPHPFFSWPLYQFLPSPTPVVAMHIYMEVSHISIHMWPCHHLKLPKRCLPSDGNLPCI